MRFTFVLAVVAALTASISASDAASDARHAQDAKEDFAASLYASSVARRSFGRSGIKKSRWHLLSLERRLKVEKSLSSSDLDNFARVGCAVTYFAKSDASWRFHVRIPQNVAQSGNT
ncbi:hypothetical protein EV424DRAFT_1344807 [Suillus variegatus]|nr:hypothetical protein EV424DRAFT_1344807 [Suillus variegatus]